MAQAFLCVAEIEPLGVFSAALSLIIALNDDYHFVLLGCRLVFRFFISTEKFLGKMDRMCKRAPA